MAFTQAKQSLAACALWLGKHGVFACRQPLDVRHAHELMSMQDIHPMELLASGRGTPACGQSIRQLYPAPIMHASFGTLSGSSPLTAKNGRPLQGTASAASGSTASSIERLLAGPLQGLVYVHDHRLLARHAPSLRAWLREPQLSGPLAVDVTGGHALLARHALQEVQQQMGSSKSW